MANTTVSPPATESNSPSSHPASTPLTLDLSSLPPLIVPSPPSNTLLITNLQDPTIFSAPSLVQIRDLINASAPLHSFSPLKSFRRIIVSFYSVDDAIRIRQLLDGEAIMQDRVRVYFGEATPVEPVDQHLHAPQSQKMFFISPPPSPPFGWEMRNEGPPNKEVHADDLAAALAKLHARPGPRGDLQNTSNSEDTSMDTNGGERYGDSAEGRTRSGSKSVVYHPGDHGDSPNLPAVMVEDTTDGEGTQDSNETVIMAHTARPPVELMSDS
ncbi:hypothetical protein MMC26_000134 [Xylographa opegraphella]|nr:hypothetical protein [Xylographa opegraphella]